MRKLLKDREFWLACGPVMIAVVVIIILASCWLANEKRVYHHPLFTIAKITKIEYISISSIYLLEEVKNETL